MALPRFELLAMLSSRRARSLEVAGLLCTRRAAGLIVLLSVSVAGCAAREGVRIPSAATTVPAENALILPPPGGPAVLNVIERRSANAVEQDVYLYTSASTPGQNFLRVQMFGPVSAAIDQKKSAYLPVRASDMMREAQRALPGVALTQSPYFLQNNYGPFGYAFGHGRGGDACLYGWQQIRPPASQRGPLRDYGTIQVRLRHCAAGATESELLAPVYGYTISGTFADPDWNPYGEPPPVDAGIGRPGNPIYREPLLAEPNLRPAVERPTPRVSAQAVRPPAVQAKQPAQPKEAPPVSAGQGGLPTPATAAGGASAVIVPMPTCAPQGGDACP